MPFKYTLHLLSGFNRIPFLKMTHFEPLYFERKIAVITIRRKQFAPSNPEAQVVQKPETQITGTPKTLGQVLTVLEAQTTISNKTKTGLMTSAINKVAKELGCSPHDIPANPAQLKERLLKISPAMACVTAGSWSSTRSRVLSALKQATVNVMPGRRTDPLAPSWDALRQLLPKRDWIRPALSRFMGFCTDYEYEPDQIQDGHFERFLSILEVESLRGEPRLIHRRAVSAWNWAVEAVAEWPTHMITIPAVMRDGYVLPAASFTDAFQSRLISHLEYLRDPPEDDDDAPLHGLKETTLKAREFSLRQIASALVHEGAPIDTLNSVADLASRDHMELLCQFYGKRFRGRENSVQVITLLDVLRGIARHQKKDDLLAKVLSKRIKKVSGKTGRRRGMTKKNKDRLLPFQNPKKVRDFLLLPLALYKRAIGKTPDAMKATLLMRNAVAMEIELMCPLREANLASLCVEKNLDSYKQGKRVRYRLYIPAAEVKNDQEISMDLPEQSCDLIQQYIKDFRHLLVEPQYLGNGLTYLFPTRDGKPMTGKNLAWAVCKILKTELGLAFNMHLFRHAACFFYLKQKPGDYETMRRTLGHKQLSTTINFYAELEQLEAFKNFDEAILLLRGSAPPKPYKNSKWPEKAVLNFPANPAAKFNLDFKGASDVI